MSTDDNLSNSLYTGFIDESTVSLEEYQPKLLVNDSVNGKKVLTSLIYELRNCDEFLFSVAFITNSGVASLISILKELEGHGIKGKIIASQYQNFTEPVALKRLSNLKNIELRIVTEGNFHAKGYIFKKRETYTLIVGSSNLTQSALAVNKEWNIKLSSTREGALIRNTLKEFEYTFKNATVVDDEWIEEYKKIYSDYDKIRENIEDNIYKSLEQKPDYETTYTREIHKLDGTINEKNKEIKIHSIFRISPNKMQEDALKSLEYLRKQNKDRALLISATGTGKTYLSAFDVKKYKPRRFLFVVHRENIARAAMNSYRTIFGKTYSMGVLCGNSKAWDSDFIFSTIQTLSKDDILHHFEEDYFDYIVIDEVHRSGAATYQKIIKYFKPRFLLGMSATPERTDGYDIYKDFNYNIAYEIRLNRALEENMLVPFHYYGVSDIVVDGELLDDKASFNKLVCKERVDNIISNAEFYGCDKGRIKGLIFCSGKDEAHQLSGELNNRGYRTIALDGDSSEQLREESIDRLETDEGDNLLDYIITVDIFNEGVDIPQVNQIIMLRPTQSAIIFIQQLGRGLRKARNKEYLVVIDFIGNYLNNFWIPIALTGDRTYNKDTIRRYLSEENRVIPGCSTVYFDEITKRKIYEAIDIASFNSVKFIKENYKQLKNKLGRIPRLADFDEHGEMDVLLIFDNSSLGSYYKFLKNNEKEYKIRFNQKQEKCIEFISKKFASGKRVHELELLKYLLNNKHHVFTYLESRLEDEYNIKVSEKTNINIINILTNEFATGAGKSTYTDCIFVKKEADDYGISNEFEEMLQDKNFFNVVEEVLDFGIMRYKKNYSKRYLDTSFQLYSKYTYEDICRLLEWEKGEVALNIGGYKYDKRTQTFPVFINYDKEEDIQDAIRYDDRLKDPSTIIALSKVARTLQSEDVYTLMHARELGVRVELFVRKNKDDKISKEFYYLGRMYATGAFKEIIMPNTTKSAVEIEYKLETPVKEELYEYITDRL